MRYDYSPRQYCYPSPEARKDLTLFRPDGTDIGQHVLSGSGGVLLTPIESHILEVMLTILPQNCNVSESRGPSK